VQVSQLYQPQLQGLCFSETSYSYASSPSDENDARWSLVGRHILIHVTVAR
jgi:hypothetical protein